MKISESWLREWVNPELTTEALAEQITMAGLEVEGIESINAPFSGVVVGEILSVTNHPDADKLQICQIAGSGETPVQVVCGAANAKVGIKVPFATIGAVLPGAFKIKKNRLRGVESFGMLCGQSELALGDDDSGLWELAQDAPVGRDLCDYLQLSDQCIEVDLTPNRSDCLSIQGIARDIGALNRLPLNAVEIIPAKVTIEDRKDVHLKTTDACPRYIGRIIRNVDLSQSSPLWMQERLRKAAVGCKDIAVDTTNYVLLELGQPMHAFDLDRLNGDINVRYAHPEESLDLLDGQSVKLSDDTLVIADESGAIAMAGIMGGQQTAVSTETKNIFLESAFFAPSAIAGRARRHGLHTDSSHRFERGVDYRQQESAVERATQLICEVAGGQAGPLVVTEAEHPILQPRRVSLRRERILKCLGFAMADEEVIDILTRLGLVLQQETEVNWVFSIPSYRFDIAIEEDLLEELARIYGYNRLPTTSLKMAVNLPAHREAEVGLMALRNHLVSRDYRETISYSFVDPAIQSALDPDTDFIPLLNPISSDMAVMRTSLWQSLIGVLKHNLKRQHSRIRLFETGLRFLPAHQTSANIIPGIQQQAVIAGLIYGHRHQESWSSTQDHVDFYDIKGDVESLMALTGKSDQFHFQAATHPAMHPGQAAKISLGDQAVGYVGALHPKIQRDFDLPQTVYLFEITQQALAEAKLHHFESLSRFPEVRRDIAVIVDQNLAVSQLESTVKAVAGNLLTNLKIFDVYVGKGIDSYRKSVALGLTFQHLSRTLTEVEVSDLINKIVDTLKKALNAELR
ncbi:MAG: phenylalanyl-tRNA synthetase beta chain [Cellvibrionaceae bacterium]|jgi:phenylalanyl-tRNA synthetase beta chain